MSRMRFGDFELDQRTRELRRAGLRVRLQPKPFQVLALLLDRSGDLVTRDELQSRVWGGQPFGDLDHSINIAIQKIRRALRDTGRSARYIETLSGRGYRFLRAVERVPEPASAAIRSVVVVPFEVLSLDAEQEFLADALTEEFISAMARIPGLRVISRTSAMRYKGTRKSVEEIARELNVHAVLEGTVSRFSELLRVNVRLIHASTERHAWVATYECSVRDLTRVQREVPQAAAEAIAMPLTAAERRRISAGPRMSPEAQQLYIRGRYFWNKRTPEDLEFAAHYFERAIAEDPQCALGYSGLADTWFYRGYGFGTLTPADAMPHARAAALTALSLDENLAEAHASIALVKLFFEWDREAAERLLLRAIELNPSYVVAHQAYAAYLAAMLRHTESVAEVERGVSVDPMSITINNLLALMLVGAGRWLEAIEQYRKTLEMDPNYRLVHRDLPIAYAAEGRFEQAVAGRLKYLRVKGHTEEALEHLRRTFESGGIQRFWQEEVRVMEARFGGHDWDAFEIAQIRARLGARDETLRWLDMVYQARSGAMPWVNIFRDFDGLRSDRAFTALLRSANLPNSR